MQRRPYKLIWLVLALLFAGQSLLPVAALAEISVRCVGAPASSEPCARMVVSLAGRQTIASRLSIMPCCRNMVSCRSMAMGCDRNAGVVPRVAAVLAAPKCLITVSPLSTTSTAAVPNVHRWLLHSAPALAPPAVGPVAVGLHYSTVFPLLPASFSFSPRLLSASHGLRAPPSA